MCKVAEPPGHLNQGMKNYPLRFPHLTSMIIIRGRRIVIYTGIREKSDISRTKNQTLHGNLRLYLRKRKKVDKARDQIGGKI